MKTTVSKRTPPISQAPVRWVEQQIDDYIKRAIRGEAYEPSPICEHPILIKKSEMLRRIGGFSYVYVWRLMKAGRFPPPVRLGAASERAEA